MVFNSNVILIISIVFSTIWFVKCIAHRASVNSHVNNFLIEEISISSSSEQRTLKKKQFINNTIYEDGIAHVEINEWNSKLYEIQRIEDAFKNTIAMNGTKYIYKRNFYWRTWRTVADTSGNISLVCYRCPNILNITCTKCDCGNWEIEENPPCPFEIFSVVNSTTICIANYIQLKISNASCPSLISLTNLVNCDNPIKSKWRLSRQYGNTDVSGRHINVICEGREICEFSTIYTILPDRIIFRIINSSNNIIYSRIMKSNNRNYACLNECGVFESPLNIATQMPEGTELESSVTQKKYLNILSRDPDIKKEIYKKDPQAKVASHTKLIELIKIQITNTSILHVSKYPTTTARLRCKHLEHHSEEEEEYNEYVEY